MLTNKRVWIGWIRYQILNLNCSIVRTWFKASIDRSIEVVIVNTKGAIIAIDTTLGTRWQTIHTHQYSYIQTINESACLICNLTSWTSINTLPIIIQYSYPASFAICPIFTKATRIFAVFTSLSCIIRIGIWWTIFRLNAWSLIFIKVEITGSTIINCKITCETRRYAGFTNILYSCIKSWAID